MPQKTTTKPTALSVQGKEKEYQPFVTNTNEFKRIFQAGGNALLFMTEVSYGKKGKSEEEEPGSIRNLVWTRY